MSLLRKESKELIKHYVEKGSLNKNQVYALWEADDYDSIMEALKAFTDDLEEEVIWQHIINNVWKGVKDEEDRRTVFSEEECIFVRELLRYGGVLTKTKAVKELFRTEYLCKKTANNLQEMKIVDEHRLKNNEVVYTLNLMFYQEARNENNT